MKTPSPSNPTSSARAELHSRCLIKRHEIEGFDAYKIEQESERDRLVARGNPKDEKAVSQLAFLNSRLSMIPPRREAFEQELLDLDGQLRAACRRDLIALGERFENLRAGLLDRTAATLADLFDGNADLARAAVEDFPAVLGLQAHATGCSLIENSAPTDELLALAASMDEAYSRMEKRFGVK